MTVEEHEEIPWSMLVEAERRDRSRTWYIAAAVVVAVVVGFTGVQWLNGHRQGETPAEAAPTATVATTATPAPAVTAMASEADLRASDSVAAELAAIARAEWFVTDYFTVDGSPAPDLVAAFADDAVLPDLPHADDGHVSFVEWARTYRVSPRRDGFVVTVLFRTLYRDDGGVYQRSPLRAADIVVLVEGGMTAIGDLPIPVAPPVAHGISGWMAPGEPAPAAAIGGALDYAAGFWRDPLLLGSTGDGDRWRVVFAADDPSGIRFPMVLRSDTPQ